MDTTSLSFCGEGGETLGEHGYSKDYRPDLKQMILALIVDGAGRPICTEMWPGNTPTSHIASVIDRLRRRFSIAGSALSPIGHDLGDDDRGSRSSQARLYPCARERSDAIVRKIVLENDEPLCLCSSNASRRDAALRKQVTIGGKRYIVCRNEAEAKKDRKDREAIVAALDAN